MACHRWLSIINFSMKSILSLIAMSLVTVFAAPTCENDAMVCNGVDYDVCANGAWVPMKCPTGTQCRTVNGKALCDFPQTSTVSSTTVSTTIDSTSTTSSAHSTPQPTNNATCSEDAKVCNGLTGFNWCVNSGWVFQQCAAGTECQNIDGTAQCVLPSSTSVSVSSSATTTSTYVSSTEVASTKASTTSSSSVKPTETSVCSVGAFRCGTNGQLEQCSHSGWQQIGCAPGTTCHQNAGGAYCA